MRRRPGAALPGATAAAPPCQAPPSQCPRTAGPFRAGPGGTGRPPSAGGRPGGGSGGRAPPAGGRAAAARPRGAARPGARQRERAFPRPPSCAPIPRSVPAPRPQPSSRIPALPPPGPAQRGGGWGRSRGVASQGGRGGWKVPPFALPAALHRPQRNPNLRSFPVFRPKVQNRAVAAARGGLPRAPDLIFPRPTSASLCLRHHRFTQYPSSSGCSRPGAQLSAFVPKSSSAPHPVMVAFAAKSGLEHGVLQHPQPGQRAQGTPGTARPRAAPSRCCRAFQMAFFRGRREHSIKASSAEVSQSRQGISVGDLSQVGCFPPTPFLQDT